MKMLITRSFAIALAAALLGLSGIVLAQDGKSSAVKLSDAELDGITAGQGAMSGVVIFNRGRGPGEEKVNNHHSTCINCLPLDVPRTSGVRFVILPGGEVITGFIRQPPSF